MGKAGGPDHDGPSVGQVGVGTHGHGGCRPGRVGGGGRRVVGVGGRRCAGLVVPPGPRRRPGVDEGQRLQPLVTDTRPPTEPEVAAGPGRSLGGSRRTRVPPRVSGGRRPRAVGTRPGRSDRAVDGPHADRGERSVGVEVDPAWPRARDGSGHAADGHGGLRSGGAALGDLPGPTGWQARARNRDGPAAGGDPGRCHRHHRMGRHPGGGGSRGDAGQDGDEAHQEEQSTEEPHASDVAHSNPSLDRPATPRCCRHGSATPALRTITPPARLQDKRCTWLGADRTEQKLPGGSARWCPCGDGGASVGHRPVTSPRVGTGPPGDGGSGADRQAEGGDDLGGRKRLGEQDSPGPDHTRSARRICSCSGVSTPSATTSRPRAWARLMTAETISSPSTLTPSASTNEPVHLEDVQGEALQVAQRRVPRRRNRRWPGGRRSPSGPGGRRGPRRRLLISALSVISSVRRSGARPVRARTPSTVWTMRGSSICRAERFDLDGALRTLASGRGCQSRSCWHACSRTQAPMGMMSPLSSATGMKRYGGTSPWSGCCQRMRASTPTVVTPAELDHRLVMEHELAALEGPVQRVLGGHPVEQLDPHRLTERHDARAPSALGLVHGGLGVGQQLGGIDRPRRN